jgi:hypothetical protein
VKNPPSPSVIGALFVQFDKTGPAKTAWVIKSEKTIGISERIFMLFSGPPELPVFTVHGSVLNIKEN